MDEPLGLGDGHDDNRAGIGQLLWDVVFEPVEVDLLDLFEDQSLLLQHGKVPLQGP